MAAVVGVGDKNGLDRESERGHPIVHVLDHVVGQLDHPSQVFFVVGFGLVSHTAVVAVGAGVGGVGVAGVVVVAAAQAVHRAEWTSPTRRQSFVDLHRFGRIVVPVAAAVWLDNRVVVVVDASFFFF